MDLANGVHIDRYQVEAKLRATPLATVYRVRHVDENVRYALKVLHLDRPTLQDRILAEGRAQSQLRHPNVVAVTDVLDIGGNPGLLSEFVHGPTLEVVLSRVRVDLDVVEQLVPGILAGVAAAHERQVVHRDLKPANILIEVTDGAFVPKIADFGLARLLGQHRSGITASGATITTPNYMAPETVRNARSSNARSDLFALGAILYELVTGQKAFANENVFATLSDITSGQYAPVRELRPETPPRIVEAIEAALELDVEDRVASSHELWQLWSGGEGPDLEQAASRPIALSTAWSLRLADLAPDLEAGTGRRRGASTVDSTWVVPRFQLPPGVTRRRGWVMAGGIAVLALVAVLVGLLLA